jgi:hypothetical protein
MQNETFTHTARDTAIKQMILGNYEPGPQRSGMTLANFESGITGTATITARGIFPQEVDQEEPIFGTHLREAARALKDLIGAARALKHLIW